MKERPILFSGPMVRAILSGQKTVTRRAIRHQPDVPVTDAIPRREYPHGPATIDWYWRPKHGHLNGVPSHGWDFKCPYGQPGDRLWVRETWGVISHSWDEHGDMVSWEPDRPATPIREMPFGNGYYSGHAIYAADGPMEWAGDEDGGGEPRSAWKPSIHMPRAACRIPLEITDVRIERLQDISYQQAMAEGIGHAGDGLFHVEDSRHLAADPRESFASLWSSINGEESWNANPWVWAVEFKRVTP